MPVPHPETAPDAVAPPPRHPRYALVDGMRALAVLAVLLVHTAQFGGITSGSIGARLLAHANIGVTIFFLISGFLLYRPFIAHRGGGAAAPRVAEYAKRRFLRIFPAYWLVLTILVLVPGAPGLGRVPLWPMYTLTQTIPIYHGASCSGAVFGCSLAQTWSLGAELSFYLALPLYVLATEWLTRRLGVLAWAATQVGLLAVLSAASLVVQFGLIYPAPLWVGWTVTGTAFWFALGMGLAVLSVVAGAPGRRADRVRRFAGRIGTAAVPLWACAIALYVGLCLWLPPTAFLSSAAQQVGINLAFGVISLLLLAPVVFVGDHRRLPHRLLTTRVMAWLGLVSYGIFLWHFPILEKIGVTHGIGAFVALCAAALASSAACAGVSYYVVERPLMRLKYRRLGRPRMTSRAGATV